MRQILAKLNVGITAKGQLQTFAQVSQTSAHTCAAAWKALTTENAPSTKAFERLLSSAMAQCHGDISQLLFETKEEPEKKPLWKKLAVWNYLRKKPAVAPYAAKATN